MAFSHEVRALVPVFISSSLTRFSAHVLNYLKTEQGEVTLLNNYGGISGFRLFILSLNYILQVLSLRIFEAY